MLGRGPELRRRQQNQHVAPFFCRFFIYRRTVQADSSKKRPSKVTAAEYVENLLAWIKGLLMDEEVFPTEEGGTFPNDFKKKYIMPIFKRLFRVYAHMYYTHYNELIDVRPGNQSVVHKREEG